MKLAPRSWYGKSGAPLKGGLPSGKTSKKTLDLINFRHPSTSRFSTINLISFFNILMKFLFEKRVNDYFSHAKS